ncbi:MAG: DUF2975 domain-containing protein [Bacteroidia bacterium]
MKQHQSFLMVAMKTLNDKFFKIESTRSLQSLQNFSRIFFIFSVGFIAAFIYKLLLIKSGTVKSFKLPILELDILPLYTQNFTGFIFLSVYEILKFITLAFVFFYFMKFIKTIDINEPFKNLKSKNHLSKVSNLCYAFFIIDAIGTLHAAQYTVFLSNIPFALFHFQYLFIAYFVHVFAIIYKRGVDLNNEIDLVI